MPTVKITDRWLKSIAPPPSGDLEYFDSNALGRGRYFGVRVSAAGGKRFFVRYRVNRKNKRVMLKKPYPELTLAAAREEADSYLRKILDGEDPAKQKQQNKREPTFEVLANRYIEEYAKPNKRTWKEDQRLLRLTSSNGWGTAGRGKVDSANANDRIGWGERLAKEITRQDVTELLHLIGARAPVQSNRLRAALHMFFRWAVSTGAMTHSP